MADVKTVFITGIAGQVGSILADYILENTSFNVIGFLRWQEPLDNLYHLTPLINSQERIFLEYGDLNDITSIQRAIEKWHPDWISHLAAQSYPRTSFDAPLETLQTNILGSAALLEVIRQLKARNGFDPIVHICSSSEVYGRAQNNVALNENTKFHAASPYSLSKIGTDYLGQFYAEAYKIRTFVTRMGTHTGRRRSDVFFESTVAKQIALIEQGFQEPKLFLGNLSSVRTFQDARDAVRAYYLLMEALENEKFEPGDVFNIAGVEAFELTEVVNILLGMSTKSGISVELDKNRLRAIDADYQMFDNSKILSVIDWRPEISTNDMFRDLLDYWRARIQSGFVPLNR